MRGDSGRLRSMRLLPVAVAAWRTRHQIGSLLLSPGPQVRRHSLFQVVPVQAGPVTEAPHDFYGILGLGAHHSLYAG